MILKGFEKCLDKKKLEYEMENLQEKNTKEMIQLYSMAIKELKRRKVIRTNNVVGGLGEYLAIEIYNSTPNMPNLAPALVGTENINAISRKGDRYSIKSTSNKYDDRCVLWIGRTRIKCT